MTCELCDSDGGRLLWRDDLCRVVLVGDRHYAGYCRVILNRHVGEMTDLPPDERQRLMNVVFAVETALRRLLEPAKINLASLGNVVPHVHWHVIPRRRNDRHFPQPIWGEPQRAGSTWEWCDGVTEQLVALLPPSPLAVTPPTADNPPPPPR